jgi:hypothetical protein
MGMGVERNDPAALPRERYPVPILPEAGWVSGLVWMGAENIASTWIRSQHRSVRNESLYQVSPPGALDRNWQINPLKLWECKPHIWTVRETAK